MLEFDWKKFLSREFLFAVVAFAIATYAMISRRCTFPEWTTAIQWIAGIWMGALSVQKGASAKFRQKDQING
jgi:hypothetical protein